MSFVFLTVEIGYFSFNDLLILTMEENERHFQQIMFFKKHYFKEVKIRLKREKDMRSLWRRYRG